MKLTKRGKVVFGVAVTFSGSIIAWGLWFVATQIWWKGSGFCIGSAPKCLGL